jgi:hypothetical protein
MRDFEVKNRLGDEFNIRKIAQPKITTSFQLWITKVRMIPLTNMKKGAKVKENRNRRKMMGVEEVCHEPKCP